jgi:NTP pyrophosphatase (non-canonical NTP hydrolase)
MNANDYQREAARTLIDGPDFEISPNNQMIIWNALGLAGEAGEIANSVKKMILHQHGIDIPKLQEELSDCCWYIAALCTKLGISLDDVLSQNIAKLHTRYPDGYSSAASKARVDTTPEPSTDAIDWAQFKVDDRAECESCGYEIRYVDPYWKHVGISPRHIGWPKAGTLRRPTILNDLAVQRASVRSPLPGDMAVCLHCQEQIRYTQYGTWEHTQGIGHENHAAEPHPF